MGKVAYISYWTQEIILCILEFIKNDKEFSISDMIKKTSIMEKDLMYILELKGIIKYSKAN